MERLFEEVSDIKDITGWKVLSILKKDDFSLTEDDLTKIKNRFVPLNIILKTNEEYWITNFYIKVMNVGENLLDNIILVSPECPDQYINFEELKKDILEPIKEFIKEEYLYEVNETIHVIEEYLKDRTSQLFKEGLNNVYEKIKIAGWDNISINNINDSSVITTSSTSRLNNELLNNLSNYIYVEDKLY